MKKNTFKILSILVVFFLFSCNNSIKTESENTEEKPTVSQSNFSQQINAARAGKNKYIIEQNIIEADKIKDFKGLNYFEPDSNYVVNAEIKFLNPEKIIFKTATEREPIYYTFCTLTFKLNNATHTLTAYSTEKENVTDLFIPFKDSTNKISTYGGGRYLELKYRNEKSNFIIDFNYAFIPYCHYNKSYSCPFVPAENWLKTSIYAGEKKLY